MTNSELKNKIAESNNSEWFNKLSVNFNFQHIPYSRSFTGLSSIYEFVNQQLSGWMKFGDSLPSELQNSRAYFDTIKNLIIKFFSNPSSDIPSLNSAWSKVRQQIDRYQNERFFPYEIPETDFLLSVFRNNPNAYQGAYRFITGQFDNLFNNKQFAIGALLTYEFIIKGESEITARRNAEKSSLNKIRTDFQNYLNESEKQLSEHLKNTRKNYQEHITQISSFKTEKEKLFSDWFDATKNEFNNFNTNSNNKISDLEKAFEELLRLKKPAEYWNLRALELKQQGWRSLFWLVGLILFACASLYSLLWLTPEGMLKTFFNDDKSLAIRWSIIFITFISFIAIGIRALMKVTFSSFHLARDAEERERLTFVYLAMIKDASIDKDDRQLVMQSLFSRAETGLLKDDSSPSMPGIGSVVDKVNLK